MLMQQSCELQLGQYRASLHLGPDIMKLGGELSNAGTFVDHTRELHEIMKETDMIPCPVDPDLVAIGK